MLVGISVKEMVLDVVPVSVKDAMDLPASVKRINVSVTRDAVLQNHKLEAEHTTSMTMKRLYTNNTHVNFCLLCYTYSYYKVQISQISIYVLHGRLHYL